MDARRHVDPPGWEAIHHWIVERPVRPLVAHFKMWHYVGVALVDLFFLLIVSFCIFAMVVNGPSFVPLLLSLLITAFIFGWTLWLYWDYKKSAKAFDHSGVVRNDGRRFEWVDFVGVDEYINLRGSMRWSYRYELIFNDGKAVVMLPKLKNRDEVLQLVTSLPGERRVVRTRL